MNDKIYEDKPRKKNIHTHTSHTTHHTPHTTHHTPHTTHHTPHTTHHTPHTTHNTPHTTHHTPHTTHHTPHTTHHTPHTTHHTPHTTHHTPRHYTSCNYLARVPRFAPDITSSNACVLTQNGKIIFCFLQGIIVFSVVLLGSFFLETRSSSSIQEFRLLPQ
jgi:hypothetical protein